MRQESPSDQSCTGSHHQCTDVTFLDLLLQVNQRSHAQLEKCLWSDTAFLSQLGVMDYSLLVGVDKTTNTLVVGIIDFIRQVDLAFPALSCLDLCAVICARTN